VVINARNGQPFPTGLIPTPRHRLAAASPFVPVFAPPPQFAIVPKQLDMWGNDQYGDCVTASEAFRKACFNPEIFIPTQTVISWASKHGVLNGADLPQVMDMMQSDGFVIGAQKYDDGPYTAVDYTNEAVLQAAIALGPVNIGIDSSALPSGAGNVQGWHAWGGGTNRNEDHCFTGDTKVSLLDGRELSFSELAAGAAGDSFWVYSCDHDGNIVKGNAHSVRKTRKNAKIVKVTIDNGESIRCTEYHRFLMRDGTYKEAKDLRSNDSLMPLYRRASKGGYELYYNPRIKGKKGWRVTHRMVAFGPSCRSGGMHAHHVDLNKRNNAPENLLVMRPEEHSALHDHLSEYSRTPEHRVMARGLMKALWDDPEWAARQRAKLLASASARGKRTVELGKSGFRTMDIETRRRNGRAAAGRILSAEAKKNQSEGKRKRIAEDPEFYNRLVLMALKASQAAALKPVTEKQREARRENARKLNARRQTACANNHKVVSVELCGCEDVYDLTVDEHHNFALSAGVFVHNCVSLSGYGPTSWLFQQLGVTPPSGAPASGYLLYTWSTIGVVDITWIRNTLGEAWLCNPTTIGVPPLGPPPPPPPPPPQGNLLTINVALPAKTYSVGTGTVVGPIAVGTYTVGDAPPPPPPPPPPGTAVFTPQDRADVIAASTALQRILAENPVTPAGK
jgi:hypothetical protein